MQKNYYSSFIQQSSEEKNGDYSISLTRNNSTSFDTTIPSIFYRIGSVGQDNRLCFWDITEDILKINNKNSMKTTHPVISPTSNGYTSFLSDTTPISSIPSATTKSSFSSLTSRLSFTRNSNKIHKSIEDTPDNSLTTLSNGSSKKSRKIPSLSGSKSPPSSTISNDSGQGSLSTTTNNSFSSRRTNFDLTKTSYGTSLCPRLDDIQIIEPIVAEFISHERLNGIFFGENYFFNIITRWNNYNLGKTITITPD